MTAFAKGGWVGIKEITWTASAVKKRGEIKRGKARLKGVRLDDKMLVTYV